MMIATIKSNRLGLLLLLSTRPIHAYLIRPTTTRTAWTRSSVRRALSSSSTPPASVAAAGSVDQQEAWRELSDATCQELLATATEAAKAAGAILKANLGCFSHADDEECEIKTSQKDIVTIYDKLAQEAVYETIQSKYPNHAFLGEEDVAAGAEASQQALTDAVANKQQDYLWICDPIDGTANFSSGLPLCAVIVAVVYKQTPLVGVIYDPHSMEVFGAIKGRGATVNGEPMKTATAVTDVKDAIVNAGFPGDPNAFEASLRGIQALNGRARGVRMIACSALTLAWIASGRLTAHYGYDLSCWDLVAGALLIQEAGGKVTGVDGSDYTIETRNMLCSNGQGAVHDQILEILDQADATSFVRAT